MLQGNVANCHPLDLAYFKAVVWADTQQLKASLEINPGVFRSPQELFSSSLGKVLVMNDGKPCRWQGARTEYQNAQQIKLHGIAVCTSEIKSPIHLKFLFLDGVPESFQILGNLSLGENHDQEFSFLVEKHAVELDLPLQTGPRHSFWNFISMGMKHIGASPSEWIKNGRFVWPEGIDHIFFILALVLAGSGFISLLKTASGFTLGHSISLGLATLNWIHLPVRWVESAIALSIVYVAAEALHRRPGRDNWKLAAFFGLIHGFGFANALRELKLPREKILNALVGFNLGVEVGQIYLLGITVPIVYFICRKWQYGLFLQKVLASAIGGAGIYWFITRAFQL